MIENRLFTIFPIYRNITDQHHRKDGMIGELNDVSKAPLWCPKTRLLPFQFRQPSTWRTLTSIMLVPYGSTSGTEIISDIPYGELTYDTADGYSYCTYYGSENLTEELECGTYYLRMYDGVNTWYSEVFTVVDITTGVYSLSVNDTDDLLINDTDSLLI